jgi:MFS family permease
MGWLVYDLTGSEQALGTIALAGGLPTTALMLFGGVIADRADRKKLVLFTQSAFAATAFTLAYLAATGQIRIWDIILLAGINGLVFAIDGPARQSMVHDIVGPHDLAAGVALQSAAFNLARVIGPILGGLLYGTLGPAWCFLTNGISFAATIGAVLLIRTDLSRRTESDGTVWAGFLEGIRHLKANRDMRSVVSLTAVTSLCAFSAYTVLMPAYARDMLKLDETRYGFLFSAIGLGSLLGAYLVGRAAAAETRGRILISGALLFGLVLLGIARVTLLPAALILLFFVGIAAISELATANTLTQTLAPDHLRGRAVAIHMFAMGGLQPLGSYVAGAVAERTSITAALSAGALILICYTVGLVALRPAVWRLE